MDFKMANMIFSIIFFLTFYGYTFACPPEDATLPCECKTFYISDILSCAGLLNPDELIKPITAVAEYKSPIEILAIVNSSLLYIPNSIFKFTKFQKVHFINSEIMALSDTDNAFEGLENTLEEIRATKASFVFQWDWKQLQNLNELQLIDITDIEVGSISVPFPNIKKLKFLAITNAGISYIIRYAFADLTELRALNLKKNDISEFYRNMLPEPAYNLITIDLSENQLSCLPENIFRNMPELENVILDHNKFTTLDRKVFSWALLNLYELTMSGNKFVCDCRLRWMAGGQLPVVFTGVCDSPRSFSGKSLRELTFETPLC